MQQLVSVASTNSSFAAAVKKFEALPPVDQLRVLTFVFSYDIGRIRFANARRRTSDERAVSAIEDKPPSHSSDSKVVVAQGPESEQRGGNDLSEPTTATNIHVVEDLVSDRRGENHGSWLAKLRKSRSVRVPNQPAANSQDLSIPMAISIPMMMIVSFSLTFGTMLWQQRKSESLATPELQIAAPVAESWGSPELVPVHDTGQPPLPRPEPIKVTIPQSLARQSIESEGDRSPGVVPVAINIWNRQNRHRIEGYVSNPSDRPLSLILEVVGQGNSVLKLDLPPGAGREFSTDSGFDMQSNDRVIVRSEPFQDLVTQVP